MSVNNQSKKHKIEKFRTNFIAINEYRHDCTIDGDKFLSSVTDAAWISYLKDMIVADWIADYEHTTIISGDKKSTKQCPKCGSTVLCLLRSLNLKICHDCKHQFNWCLDLGQKKLI